MKRKKGCINSVFIYIYKLRNIQCRGTEGWKRSSKRKIIFTIGTPEMKTTSAAKENKGGKKSLQMRNLYDTRHTSIHSWKRLLWTTVITSTQHFKVVCPLYPMRPIPFSFTLLLSQEVYPMYVAPFLLLLYLIFPPTITSPDLNETFISCE